MEALDGNYRSPSFLVENPVDNDFVTTSHLRNLEFATKQSSNPASANLKTLPKAQRTRGWSSDRPKFKHKS